MEQEAMARFPALARGEGLERPANKRSMVKSLKFIYLSAANGEGT
jgi:hypothetical protein